ncbi:MAG: tyrosine-type recombinase/integrase [Provencibacterium sp.]|jgi:integrase/recombinase XerD|nr:tyrosine-type recombinase/integrase [Provencibacterium sp.]
MTERQRTEKSIHAFGQYLSGEEREPATIEKYLRDVRGFLCWLKGRPVAKERAAEWKESLHQKGCGPATINGKLSALNKWFAFLGRMDCRLKYLKIQRKLFRSAAKELTKQDYTRLLETAYSLGRERLALLMETMCATGIRVSEVKYMTVEVVQAGRADIALKGKIRTILIPGKLCRKLQKYARKRKIASGEIFLTRSGKGLGRRQIWAEMKSLCKKAGVEATKVFPHNLRHLFARTFYRACRDVAKLADVLGHSSMETTRLYLISTGAEHARQLERLGLIC